MKTALLRTAGALFAMVWLAEGSAASHLAFKRGISTCTPSNGSDQHSQWAGMLSLSGLPIPSEDEDARANQWKRDEVLTQEGGRNEEGVLHERMLLFVGAVFVILALFRIAFPF